MAEKPTAPRERLWPGVLAWTAFSVVAVLARGVQWDENFEFAQTMTGQVPYPDGHPFKVYTLGAYNLQIYLSALIVYFCPSPIVLCAIRNFLFILASTVPQFLLGAVISRRAIAGHVTVVLFLSGIHLAFDGSYPLFVWPGMFSNGHIGTGYALICVALLVARRYAVGGFLIGLLPAVHLGQAPTVFVLLALQAGIAMWRKDIAGLRGLAVWFLVGASLSVACYFVVLASAAGPAADGPYATQGDPAAYWSGRISGHDMHRSIPVGNSHVLSVGLLMLAAFGLRATRQSGPDDRLATLAFYAVTVLAVIYFVIAVQMIRGPNTPYLVLGWLPYRLYNHLPPILLALLVGVCFRRDAGKLAGMVPAAVVLMLLVAPRLIEFVAPQVHSRYFESGEWALFFLFGAAATMLVKPRQGPTDQIRQPSTISWRPTVTECLLISALAIGLTPFHQFGAAMIAVGGCVAYVVTRIEARRTPAQIDHRIFRWANTALASVLTCAILIEQASAREQLPVGNFEHAVAEYLNHSGEPGAMLLSAPYQLLLQAQTGHPVLVDMATAFYGSYRPSLGGATNAIYTEIYGIDFARRPDDQGPDWKTVWAGRSPEEWRHLGARWGFRYVVARKGTSVNLPVVLTVENSTLHAVFDESAARGMGFLSHAASPDSRSRPARAVRNPAAI